MYGKVSNLKKILRISLQSSVLAIALVALLGSASTSASPIPTVSAAPGQPANPTQSAQVQSQLKQAVTANSASSHVYYYNWSGYAATSATPFNAVESTFVQPAVTCTVPGAWTLFWVGFDGFDNGTVEQAGTAAQCSSGTNPQPVYYTWWEMWPTNNIQIMPVTIKPGDTIKAKVTYTAKTASYSMNVVNKTNLQHYTQVSKCDPNLSCARQSAEWIVERPTVDGAYTPLAKWGNMQLKSNVASNTATTTGKPVLQPIGAFNNTSIDMINDQSTGAILTSVSALNPKGNLFSDTWLAAQ
jgi:hypothetical protein